MAMSLKTLWLAGLLAGLASPALAQPEPIPRGYVFIGGSYLATHNDFENETVKRINAEDGRYVTSYDVNGGPSLEAAVGVTVWKRLGIRAGLSRVSRATGATLEASVPHPFFFNQPRSITGDVSGLNREELALDLHLAGVIPLGARAQATVFAGPTWLQLKQGMVTDFTYTDSYPFDTAAFGRAVTSDSSGSAIGIGGGAGLNFFLTRSIGLAAAAQFSRATVALPGAGETKPEVKAGGFRAGAGVVIRF